MIEVGLCCDEGYAMPCGVCITSLFESNKDSKFHIHILASGFTEKTISRLKQTGENYGQIVDIYNLDLSKIGSLRQYSYLGTMSYARLLFPEILDYSITKLLYLDCDIVVIGDIKPLWESKFENKACLAAPEVGAADNINTHNFTGVYNHYINAGVLLFNLDRWRVENIGGKCIEFVCNYPERCRVADQDAINILLGENDMGYLPFKYNFTVPLACGKAEVLSIHKKWWPALAEAQQTPVIIHYISGIKPWHKEFVHHTKEYFVTSLKHSLWGDYKIKYRCKGKELLKYKTRKILRKVKIFISNILETV